MNKELIKNNKEAFEYWLNGGSIILAIKNSDESVLYDDLGTKVEWGCNWENPKYLQNDEYIEFRKALYEGKTVQYLDKYDWVDCKSKEPLSSFASALKYRIKPEEELPFPQVGDEYWYLTNTRGTSSKICTCTNNTPIHTFKTQKEAEAYRDLELAKQRVKYAIAKANDGWVPDFENESEKIYLILLWHSKLVIEYIFYTKIQPYWMYIKSEAVAKQILKDHKEDLLLILGE